MNPDPPLPGILGRAAAWMYAEGIGYRNRRFDARKGVVEFDRPCFSIGNLSTGGTGKTPIVKWLAGRLLQAGHDPCIAMRGYKAVGGQSDEALEYADRFPQMPCIVGADRTKNLIDFFATARGKSVDSIILDDGFQHRQIARQCDIVIIDATRSPFDDALLPAGHLREPVENLNRAAAIVITRCDVAGDAATSHLQRQLSDICACPIALTTHRWTNVRRSQQDRITEQEVSSLQGKRLVACCGIGNPNSFFEQVRRAGANLVHTLALPDHDAFSHTTIDRILRLAQGTDGVILTEKDWTKLKDSKSLRDAANIFVPRVNIEFVSGESELWAQVCQVFERFATE